MSAIRKRTIVVDVSVLPKRPKVGSIQQFLENKLGLNVAMMKAVQLHNIKNTVLITLSDAETASKIVAKNNLKHTMDCDGKPYSIPIYVDEDTIQVRVHDLPVHVPNTAIAQKLGQFGDVLTVRNELWKQFFPGTPNGVRIVHMKPIKPIPAFIIVENEKSLVTIKHGSNKQSSNETQSQQHSSQPNLTLLLPPPPPSSTFKQRTTSSSSNSKKSTTGEKRRRLQENQNHGNTDVGTASESDSVDEMNDEEVKKLSTLDFEAAMKLSGDEFLKWAIVTKRKSKNKK